MKETLKKLMVDEHYYGAFGKQFLSNSDIDALLNNPLSFQQPKVGSEVNFLLGRYFHTMILEPDKLENFKEVDTTTRNTKIYKDAAKDGPLLLTNEAQMLRDLKDKMMNISIVKDLIVDIDVEYEVPNIVELFGEKWKCKADVKNNTQALIVDVKTTSNLKDFEWSARKYNYDSQAYIYSQAFGMDFVFAVADKVSKQVGVFECSPSFLERGKLKVEQAVEVYQKMFKKEGFDFDNYCVSKILK